MENSQQLLAEVVGKSCVRLTDLVSVSVTANFNRGVFCENMIAP